MDTNSEQIQMQYELAMAIGASLDLDTMLRQSLKTLLRKLNCPAGGVYFFNEDYSGAVRLQKVMTIPGNADHIEAYQKTLAHIPAPFISGQSAYPQSTTLAEFNNRLPVSGKAEDIFFSIAQLPGLGVVVLLNKSPFEDLFVKSLGPVFTKLAIACNACLQNEELIQHQENLQELVSAKTSELLKKNRQLTDEIVNRKKVAEALIKSEEKYRELVQNANNIILRWDTAGRITFFNEYAQTFFGYKEEEIVGRHVVGTIVPENESTGRDLRPLMDDICSHPQKYAYNINENICKDGSRVWVAWTNKILKDASGNLVGALSIGTDITKHRETEEKLLERERELAEAQKIAHLGNWSWDIPSNQLKWSDEIFRIFKVARQTFGVTYDAFLERVHPADRKMVRAAVNDALYHKKPYDIVHRIVLENGSERIVHEFGRATRDQSGNPIRMVGVVQDITERYHSEQRFKMAAEAISDLIYEWDVQNDALLWFGDIDTALGFDPGEFPQTLEAWIDRIHPNDVARLANAVDLHRTSTEPISYEYRIRNKSGSWVYWSDYGVPVLSLEGQPYKWIGACSDITKRKAAEQKLRESEERYRALFTNEIDAICIFEIETKQLVDVNDAWLKLYGYRRDEFESLTIDDLSAELKSTHKAVKRSAQLGNVFIPERRHMKKDGTEFVVEISAGPFTWKGRQLMYALARDITERKRAEDKLKENEHLLAETQKIAQLGSWEFEVASQEIHWSEETFRIAGRKPKDKLTLQEYLDMVHPDDHARLEEVLDKAMADKRPYEVELRHRRPDNTYNFTLTRGKPIVKGNQVVKFIGSVLDITERNRAKLELQRAKEAAEAANKAKSAFLANMSHELRTPLNAILGFSELMKRDQTVTPAQLDNLEIIGRSGEHLLSLINDVLDFSKIEAGRIVLNPENFDLHWLLLGIEEMFRLRTREKGLSLDFEKESDVPQYIIADQNKLRQILINLLGNAVKFTESGEIVLSVSRRPPVELRQSEGCVLNFEVTDTGAGISPEEQGMIFDTFFRVVGPRSSQQGAGLGLPISQKFARLMGGELTVESKVGQGTRFAFSISVGLPDADEFQSEHSRQKITGLASGAPDLRLLVAEDNTENRVLLVKLLQNIGCAVKEAVDGQEALEVWETWRPHLVWMDMRMPVLDGYEATRRIKSKSGNETVIIALTASAFEEDRQKFLEVGGDDFVRKPFREAEIFQMLAKHFHVRFEYAKEIVGTRSISDDRASHEELIAMAAALPADLLAILADATELSDAARIDTVIDDIQDRQAKLAEELSQMAESFAYDHILAITQEVKAMRAFKRK